MASLDDLNPDQRAALIRFRKAGGHTWRHKLHTVWLTDPRHTDAPLLRQIRNEFGPDWLADLDDAQFDETTA